jgi:hypothetical protein
MKSNNLKRCSFYDREVFDFLLKIIGRWQKNSLLMFKIFNALKKFAPSYPTVNILNNPQSPCRNTL